MEVDVVWDEVSVGVIVVLATRSPQAQGDDLGDVARPRQIWIRLEVLAAVRGHADDPGLCRAIAIR
jgi:hypothetical protein